MPTIDQLCAVDSVADDDQLPVYSRSNSDARRLSVSNLRKAVAAGLTANDDKATQYSAPSASPFSATIATVNSVSVSVWLVITPTGTMASGTINLPPQGTAFDRQEVLVNTTQAVTALTVAATNSNVTGAPTTLSAGGAFRMRYDAVSNTWFKV